MLAEELARALRATKVGSSWMALCPAHTDSTPSLSISRGRSGKPLVHCFAGCSQVAVISALAAQGVWSSSRDTVPAKLTVDTRSANVVEPNPMAMTIWQASRDTRHTVAEVYAASRGLTLAGAGDLRFHPRLKHPIGTYWPCLVALVTGGVTGEPQAIHRTFLKRDGSGKAPVEPQKMMLGPCRGGVVRLGEASDLVMVGEGIETCLAAMQATGIQAWAALSTSGMRRLELPKSIDDVIVLADGDKPGEAAAVDCATCWRREGRRIRIARPPRGSDFNDVLLTSHHDEVAS